MEFDCQKDGCTGRTGFDYADYDFRDYVKGDKDYFDEISCNKCGAKYKTVPWIAVIDENDEPVAYV